MTTVPYQPASFRGVPFHVEATTSDIAGRRAAIHEYAGADESYPEDLGGKAQSFSLTGYVVGKEYQAQRDTLIKACTDKGIAELVHPYMGTLQVLCTACSVIEGTDKGRMASFSLSFAKAPKTSKPITRPDTAIIAKNKAADFADEAEESFLEGYVPDSMPSFASEDLIKAVSEVTSLVSQASDMVSDMVNGTIDMVTDTIDAFNPVNLVQNITSNIASLGFNEALNLIKDVSNIAAPLATSQAGLEVMRLVDELTNFTTRQAIAQSAIRVAEIVFVSASDASQAFFAVDEQLGKALETASARGEDALFFTAQDVRYALSEHIKKTAVHLPEVEKVLVAQTNASLPIAYDITGNADNALDFATRNKLKHPSFTTGGEIMEVLHA